MVHRNLSSKLTTNAHNLLQINLNNTEIQISGSEEAAVYMDVTYTDFALEVNFNAIFKKAYEKCRNDTFCDYLIGSEIELINLLALDYIDDDGNDTLANQFME